MQLPQLYTKIDDLEFEKKKEEHINQVANQLNAQSYIVTGICCLVGKLFFGGFVFPLFLGYVVYLFYQLIKKFAKGKIEDHLGDYVVKHPTASKQEILDQIMNIKVEDVLGDTKSLGG